MAQLNPPDDPGDTLDSLETLDNLHAVDTGDDSDAADDEVIVVHSSELIEPLETMDVLALDYDEQTPTRVDGPPRERRETYPPACDDLKDIYLLTEDRRSTPPGEEERVDMARVLRPAPLPVVVAPPRRDTIPPAFTRQAQMNSIAPVALAPEPEPLRPQAARTQSPRFIYGSLVAALAAAAVVVAWWPSTTQTPAVDAQPVAAANPHGAAIVNTAEVEILASEPVMHKLGVVEIVGEAPALGPQGASRAALVARGVVAAPPADPSTEVVIDDAAQLSGEVVFPNGGEARVGTSSVEPTETEPTLAEALADELAPPAPPAADPLPFDRAAAASAMDAAAAMVRACRTEGMPQTTARVSVTFAPSGRVTTAVVDGAHLAGTTVGGCVARGFRTLRLDPFAGPAVTVHKSFQF